MCFVSSVDFRNVLSNKQDGVRNLKTTVPVYCSYIIPTQKYNDSKKLCDFCTDTEIFINLDLF